MVVSAAGGHDDVRVRFRLGEGRRRRWDERGDVMAGGEVGSRGAPG